MLSELLNKIYTRVLSVIIFHFLFIGCLHIFLHVHVKVNLYHVIT